jgi:phage I-like protein
VLANFEKRGRRITFDYDHKSLDPLAPPESGKSAGTASLEVRDGELWAVDVRWSPAAEAGIRAKEWLFISPFFAFEDASRRVLDVLNVAITNLPATHDLQPLVAARADVPSTSHQEKPMKTLAVALGLADSAGEQDMLAAVASLKSAHTALAQLSELTGKTSPGEILGVVTAWKTNASTGAEAIAELAAVRAKQVKDEHEALVKLGLDSGQITTALEPWARKQSNETLKSFLEVADARVPGAKEHTQPTEASSVGKPFEELTAEEKHRLANDNRAAFNALKADYQRRTAGARS